jgi:hypothetical protein
MKEQQQVSGRARRSRHRDALFCLLPFLSYTKGAHKQNKKVMKHLCLHREQKKQCGFYIYTIVQMHMLRCDIIIEGGRITACHKERERGISRRKKETPLLSSCAEINPCSHYFSFFRNSSCLLCRKSVWYLSGKSVALSRVLKCFAAFSCPFSLFASFHFRESISLLSLPSFRRI